MPDTKIIAVDIRCPDEILQRLESIGDQIAKEQYFNAMRRVIELNSWCLLQLQKLLKDDQAGSN